MSLSHAMRFPDQYTPREIALHARREGFDVEIPDSPQGTPYERARQIEQSKSDLLEKVKWQRLARSRNTMTAAKKPDGGRGDRR